MTPNFIIIWFALFSLGPVSLTLLSLCCWKSHTNGLLSWRNWDEAVYRSVIRGVPEKNTFSKPKDHSLDSHEGRIVATKVLPGAWIQNVAKRWLTLQQTIFKGVILINNRQGSLSCNSGFELFNPIDSKHYIVENSISMPKSVTVWCTSGAHFRSLNFVFYLY